MEGQRYVLVHGAFHGGWCWREVADRLRSQGHTVYTPTLTGMGDRKHLMSCRPTLQTWAQDIAQLIYFEDLYEVTLVGHSFAGSVVSLVADRAPERLKRLVYLDALVLRPGEAVSDRAPSAVSLHAQRARGSGENAVIPPPPAAHFGVVNPSKAAWLEARLTSQPLSVYSEKLTVNGRLGNSLPVVYVACSDPFFSSTLDSRELAQRMRNWEYVELSAPHNAMTTHPSELADLLLGIES